MIHRYGQYMFMLLMLGCNQNDSELEQHPFVLEIEVNAIYEERFGKPWDFEKTYGIAKPFELELTRVEDTLRVSFFELEVMSSGNSSRIELLGDSIVIHFEKTGGLVRELAIYQHHYRILDTLDRNYLKFISSYGDWKYIHVSRF